MSAARQTPSIDWPTAMKRSAIVYATRTRPPNCIRSRPSVRPPRPIGGAAAWMLERMDPVRFSRQDIHRLTKPQMVRFKNLLVKAFTEEITDVELAKRIIERVDFSMHKFLNHIEEI
ncbi:MAG: hypothetical protein WD669_05845 [Pirellulales bacterium]